MYSGLSLLANVYRVLEMSSIFWSTKPKRKLTYGTLIHIDLDLEALMLGPELCENPLCVKLLKLHMYPSAFMCHYQSFLKAIEVCNLRILPTLYIHDQILM